MRQSPISKIRELTAILNQWRHEYYNLNSPTVSDAVYDQAFDELQRLERETGFSLSNSPTQTVGFPVVDGLEKTTHTIPLLSLEKIKNINDLMRFIGTQQVILMHKLDGLTVKLEYENGSLVRGATRGDGDVGEVITHNARAIEGIPSTISYTGRLVVVGEAYITKPTFEKLKETLRDSSGNQYKNARNMAAGSVRLYDAGTCAGRGVEFSAFNVLEGLDEDNRIALSKFEKLRTLNRLGFPTCEYILQDIASEQKYTEAINILKNIADENGTPIDGIVITCDSILYSKACGRTGHHYKDGIAFKFEDELYETVLRNVEWQPSRSGELSPVAIFDNVEIDGCDISRASLHNLTFIRGLELIPGCRILISKRNMIIPYIEENLDRGNYDDVTIIPVSCPCCNKPTRIDTSGIADTLHCDNTNCAAQRLRQFIHFVGKKAMDIEGLSESTLDKFITKGWLNDLTDIYRLDRYADEIINMDGFGEKSWYRLWNSIQKSCNTTFVRFVVSMDIPMIGRTASRELCKQFNNDLNAFEAAVYNRFDFTRLEGFGETLHRNLHDWFTKEKNIYLWKELQKMTMIEKNTETIEATDNPFSGRTIVVTGKLEHFTRDSINAKISSLGAIACSTVSSKTDYLVCGAKAGSKLAKAQSLGIPVLSERQFLDMSKSA